MNSGDEALEIRSTEGVDSGGGGTSSSPRKATTQRVGASRSGEGCAHARGVSVRFRYEDRMRARSSRAREIVSERANDAPTPRCVRQQVHRTALRFRKGPHLRGQRHVVHLCVAEKTECGFVLDEGERVAIAAKQAVELHRCVVEILDAFAVAIVVEAAPELREPFDPSGRELQRHGRCASGVIQIVAECRDHRPRAPTTTEIAIDDEARAQVRAGVDVHVQLFVHRYFAGKMVIEIPAPCAACEQPHERLGVLAQRHVEHDKFVASLCVDLFHEPHVALHTSHEDGVARLGEPQLMQGAQTVRVAVEDIVICHA